MTQPQAIKQETARSPFAGCAILITALAVMLFLIGFSVLTLFRQFDEIAKFTSGTPVSIPVTALENRSREVEALTQRFEKFRQELTSDTETTLSLTADELNLAIAAFEPLKELRGTLRVAEISGDSLHLAISFPLNGKPRFTRSGEPGWTTSDARYLNGTMVARPALLKKEIILSLTTIEVPGKTVAPEFIDQMSPYRITERYLVDKTIGPAMARLTQISVADGKLIATRKPGEVPADHISNDQVDRASNRLFTALGIAACIFLSLVGLIVLIGIRAKSRKNPIP